MICYYLSLAEFHVIYGFLKIYKKIKNQTCRKAAKLSVVQMRNNMVLSDVFRHHELKFTASQKSLGITGHLYTCYLHPLQRFIIKHYYSGTMLSAVHRYWKNFKAGIVKFSENKRLGAQNFNSYRDLLHGFGQNIHSPFTVSVKEG